eukprot:2232395-Ditylum_brightwellii.AAC.1
MTATTVEPRASCHRLLILHCACLIGKLMTATMDEFRASCHRLFILSCACLMETAIITAVVEFDAGIGSRSSRTIHSSWHSRCQKGVENCHGRSMNISFEIIKSQTRLSTSRSSDGQ